MEDKFISIEATIYFLQFHMLGYLYIYVKRCNCDFQWIG